MYTDDYFFVQFSGLSFILDEEDMLQILYKGQTLILVLFPASMQSCVIALYCFKKRFPSAQRSVEWS